MASSEVQRKLTAILCTDVVGYSRLMGDDPEGTLSTLTEYREVFSSKIQEFKGRVVNAPGDSILADFTSVLDAVSCAVDIQRELAERNHELPDERRMDFRIGVNLGDVLVKDGDIYGDGVNVAARLEALAEPGGICISGSVHEQVKVRLPLVYDFIGEKRVKNIAEPVKTYRVLSKPGAAAHRVIEAKRTGLDVRRKILLAAAVMVLIMAVGGVLAWNKWGGPPEAGKEAAREAAPPSLPARPSIAVLAFNNLSDDPRQEFFADGISEDIITDLSKIKGLFVVARNSSFAYKGKAVDVAEVGRKLRVRYILEGSVRRVDERIRVTAQLIDTKTGSHQWAERYDRRMENVFDIQDEITEKIVAALKVELTLEEADRIRRKTTNNLEAWEHYVKGMNEYHRFLSSFNIYRRGGGRANHSPD